MNKHISLTLIIALAAMTSLQARHEGHHHMYATHQMHPNCDANECRVINMQQEAAVCEVMRPAPDQKKVAQPSKRQAAASQESMTPSEEAAKNTDERTIAQQNNEIQGQVQQAMAGEQDITQQTKKTVKAAPSNAAKTANKKPNFKSPIDSLRKKSS